MRTRLMVVATALLVLATMGPPALAGDSFWHGADIGDSGPTGLIPYKDHWELHKYLATLIPGFAGRSRMAIAAYGSTSPPSVGRVSRCSTPSPRRPSS